MLDKPITLLGCDRDMVAPSINTLVKWCHQCAVKQNWWHDVKTGKPLERNHGEMIALIHSELSECLEALRKNSMDKHLPHRHGEEVELADAVIRIFDYAGGRNLDLGGAIFEKMVFNSVRDDHKPEVRQGKYGKKF